jgi:cyanophycin synthetase
MTHAPVELRVLDGPNLYFPRPAIKLTLDVAGLLGLPEERAAASGVRALAVRSRPGPDPTQVVVAYPWRRLHAAEALGPLTPA